MSSGIALLPLLAAVALSTARAAAAEPDPITVTGAPSSSVIHARATAFVRATGVAAGEMPAARWADPVCPRVVGITDPAAAHLVEATLRSVAADAGITPAPAPCRANIAVVFATDGGAVVRDIVARSPRRLSGLTPAAVAALTNGAAPIRWWYASEVRDKDGMAASSTSPVTLDLGAVGAMPPDNEEMTFVQHTNTSLVSTEDIRALRAATVVVDVTRTAGLPLSAIASYAAMVAFAELRPGAAPPDSVLALFAGGPVLRRPTAWDTAFLRALYRLPLDRAAGRQRGMLVAALSGARQVDQR